MVLFQLTSKYLLWVTAKPWRIPIIEQMFGWDSGTVLYRLRRWSVRLPLVVLYRWVVSRMSVESQRAMLLGRLHHNWMVSMWHVTFPEVDACIRKYIQNGVIFFAQYATFVWSCVAMIHTRYHNSIPLYNNPLSVLSANIGSMVFVNTPPLRVGGIRLAWLELAQNVLQRQISVTDSNVHLSLRANIPRCH